MIRPTTVLCLLTACGSGLYLYSEKHRTELLDRDIGRVIHATEAARARTGLLRAEWALLNEPGRLEDMAGRYLTLHPMAPSQFVQLADLSNHLPAPVATPPGGAPDDDDASQDAQPATVVAQAAPATDPALASAAQPDAPGPTPPPMPGPSTVQNKAKPPAKLLASAGTRARPQHHVVLADRQDAPSHDGMLAHGTPLPLAAPQPVGASVYSAMARPMHVTRPPVIVAAIPSTAPAQSFARPGYVPSALGGGTALPPPVPYGR